MVPPVVRKDSASQGEIEVFQRLRDDPASRDWIVLHSLGLAQHERRVAGEIDFVVIVPRKGVLCLEVKGCSTGNLRRINGVWYYGPDDTGDVRGPFRQASEAMHTLRRRLAKRRPELATVFFASGVLFPYARFTESSIEWNDWEVIDTASIGSAPLCRLLTRLLDKARDHLLRARSAPALNSDGLTPGQCVLILNELRGDFEIPADPRARGSALESELRRYTAEQFEALDAMSDNPRTLFCGPAGTGKTLLAVEAARRAREEGRRVLFVCFNHLLGAWLDEQTAPLRPQVVTGTVHRRMLTVAGLARPSEDVDSAFWDDELPARACERLAMIRGEGGQAHVYDELIVDEAQDLLRERYLNFLDLSLRGGLGAGRWRIFGDFENQAIYGSDPMSIEEFRSSRANGAPVYSLRVNCRNTPLVAEWVHLLGGLTPAYWRVLRPDDGVRPHMLFYRDANEQRQLLASSLSELRNAGFAREEIVVLSTRSVGSCATALMDTEPWKEGLRPLGAGLGAWIRQGTIHAFKGLESPAVVVTDVETVGSKSARALFYVAITRALQRLIILAHDRVRAEALEILSRIPTPRGD
jgi:DNA polymerase III delta prime subunit